MPRDAQVSAQPQTQTMTLACADPGHRSWQELDRMGLMTMQAPRYTSYPSAHHFTDLGAEAYGAWLSRLDPKNSIALYVHIPFCERMCHFCGCHTRATRHYQPVFDYVGTLIQEIALVSARLGFRPSVHSLHFGGGSPSILNLTDFERLMIALSEAFVLKADAELSLELDPRRVDPAKVATYRAMGMNRVSLGVQDTDPTVQAAINRVQHLATICDAFADLRAGGIEDIGIDLIYGLPHQSTDSLERTMAHVRALAPRRVCVFSYAHVPWMKKHQILIDTATLPDMTAKIEAFDQIRAALTGAGYESVGLDHFVQTDDRLALALKSGRLRRNFMGYVDAPNDLLIGFGASAIGETDAGMAQNISQPTTYRTRIAAGQLATQRGWTYGGEDKVRKALISQMMCTFAVDAADVAQSFGYDDAHFDADLERLVPFEDAGIVVRTGRHVRFTAPERQLVRAVACVFDTYACKAEADKEATTPRYSRVA